MSDKHNIDYQTLELTHIITPEGIKLLIVGLETLRHALSEITAQEKNGQENAPSDKAHENSRT